MTYYQRNALVLFFVVRPNPIVDTFLGCMSSSTFLERALSFSSTLPNLSSRIMLFPSFLTVLFSLFLLMLFLQFL